MAKYKDSTLPISERVEDLLSRMTLKEKVGQLNQHLYGFKAYDKVDDDFEPNEYFKKEVERFGGIGVLYGLFRADPWSGRNYRTGIKVKDSAKVANMFQRYVIENTRLGIPMLISTECPHGHQALDGYIFSTNLGAACSFNPELLERAYAICARQMRAMGIHLALSSVLDVLRDPRWGRSEECFSEDPYLTSELAKAVVYGIQGRNREEVGERQDKTMMVAKHLCGQGETTGGLNASPASIGERELREIHLPAVKACCDAGVYSFMAAYNEIDGVMCHANKKLLTGILRDEYGFDGAVMADGCALDRLVALTGDVTKAAALAIKAGVDISLWDDTYTQLEEAVYKNEITMEELDNAVRRVLTLKFKMGLFENPYVDENNPELFTINYENNTESLELAQESIVLLKNKDNILPLDKSYKSIAVIGPNADNIYNQIGDYVPEQNREEVYTVLDGIKKVCDSDTVIRYAKGCGIRSKDTSGFAEAIEIAKQSDIIIFVPGGSSARDFNVKYDANGAIIPTSIPSEMDCGEGLDVSSLSLGGVQNELMDELAKLGKPIISVVIQGRPYCLTNISEKSNALLTGFYPGPVGGLAIAQIIFGYVNPSGKLSVSLPKTPWQLPVYYNRKSLWANLEYVDFDNKPLYPFGYGLSYSKFTYTNLISDTAAISTKELEDGKEVEIKCDVTNESEVPGKATVQLYIQAEFSEITRRWRELKGFKKIHLDPNETKQVTFKLDADKLSFIGIDGKKKVGPQSINIYVGDSCMAELSTKIKIL